MTRILRVSRVKFLILTLLGILSVHQTFSAVIVSNAVTGNWSNPGSWVGGIKPVDGDDVIIVNGAIITMQGNTTMKNLTINAGGILTDNGSGTITITGNLIVNGTLAGGSQMALNSPDIDVETISGVGVISNTSIITITGSKDILANSKLIKGAGQITLATNTIITNKGSVTFGGNLVGGNSSSIWINDINSVLNIGGALLSTGTLEASAIGNTINYYGAGTSPQTIKRVGTTNFTYYNLTISGSPSSIKTFGSNTYTIEGRLTLNSSLSCTSNLTATTIIIKGDWNNNGGTFDPKSGTVIFNGSSIQAIQSTNGETFYNLTVNNSSTGITADNNITVTSNLTLTDGNINVGSNTITLGTSTSNVGSLLPSTRVPSNGYIIGKFERWISSISLPVAPVLFPVGSATSYNPITLTLNEVTSPGALIGQFIASAPGSGGFPLTKDDNKNGLPDDVQSRNPFRDGYWSLTPNVDNPFSSSNYDLSLTLGVVTPFTDPAYNGIDNNTRLLTREEAPGTDWTMEGEHNQWISGNTVSRKSLSTLGAQYCFGDDTPCDAPISLSITGNNILCNGTSDEMYSVTETSGSTYTWAISSGSDNFTGQGTSDIVVDWSSVGGVRTITVVEDNGCTLGAEASFDVNVLPLSPGVIIGKQDAPTNISNVLPFEKYSVPEIAGYTYDWDVTGNVISWTGDGTNEISVRWGSPGNGQVKVKASYNDGILNCIGSSGETILNVEIYSVIFSNKVTGNWGTENTWTCNCQPGASDNVVILNGHTVSANINGVVNNLIVNSGGILNINNPLTVNGNLTLNGVIGGTNTLTLGSTGGTPVIDGIGSFSTTAITISANREVGSNAILTKTANSGLFTVGSNVTLTNNGAITFTTGAGNLFTISVNGSVINNGSITLTGGLSASNPSVFTNNENAILSVGGALMSTAGAILNASAVGNTVRYTGTSSVNIKTPSSSQYYNLSISNTGGTKTVQAATLNISGDFTDERTSTGAFSAGNGTIVFNGNSSILGAPVTPTSFNNVTITGALTSSAGSVNIAGNLINNGAFNHNNGTIVFNGTTASSISGTTSKTTFYNLTANNLAGLTIEKNVDLINVLNVGSGAYIDVDGSSDNREFSLKSSGDNPAVDASVGVLTTTTAVRGKLTVERFISNEGRLYRYLSTPVQGANVSDWMDDFPVTGLFPDKTTSWSGSLCGTLSLVSNSASLFYYNEPTPGNFNLGYVAYPIANGGINATASPLSMGRGYAAFIRVCPNEGLRVDLKGEIYQGLQNLPVSYTSTIGGGALNDGWNLVGNPYASAIDWDVTGVNGWTKTNLTNSVAVTDNATGMMRYWDGSTGTLPGGVIASGQAFWVQANGASPALTIREGVKVTSNTPQFYRESDTSEDINSVMTISLTNPKHLTDYAYVKVRERVSVEMDQWDATKLENGGPGMLDSELFELSTLTPSGISMAINAIPSVYEGMSIPLEMRDLTDGLHVLNFEGNGEFEGYQLELTDNYSRIKRNLKWGDSYTFVAKSTDPASFENNRITLKLVKDSEPISIGAVFNLVVFPNPVKENLTIALGKESNDKIVTVYNIMGEMMAELSFGGDEEYGQIDFNSRPTGVYLIRLSSAGYTRWAKVIKN